MKTSLFDGLEAGTLVTLGPGNYNVTETPKASVAADIEMLGGNITGPNINFTGGDCTQTGFNSTSAKGDILAGASQTCNIINNFTINEDPKSTLTVSKKFACTGEDCTRLLPVVIRLTTITVTGNGPTPPSFVGSATGTNVTIGAGSYTVSETVITHPAFTLAATFSGGCINTDPTKPFTATGTIVSGVNQNCEILNTYTQQF